MNLRKLAAEDLQLYRVLRMDAVTQDSRTLITTPTEESRKTDEELLKMLAEQCVLAAFREDKAVGMATLMRHEGERRYHVAEVQWVYVSPDNRRQGIAKALMEAVEAHAKSVGIECIELHVVADNSSAIGMYQLLGYEEHGKLPKAVKIGQSYWDGIYMVKFL